MDRAADLRSDYDRLGELLTKAEGSAAAAIARERRMLGELLEALERPTEVSLVVQLADRRNAKSSDSGAAARRRKSG
jgi:hypothetical protein